MLNNFSLAFKHLGAAALQHEYVISEWRRVAQNTLSRNHFRTNAM